MSRGQFSSVALATAAAAANNGASTLPPSKGSGVVSGKASNIAGSSGGGGGALVESGSAGAMGLYVTPGAGNEEEAQGFEALTTTFSNWLTNRKYDLYHSWSIDATTVPGPGTLVEISLSHMHHFDHNSMFNCVLFVCIYI